LRPHDATGLCRWNVSEGRIPVDPNTDNLTSSAATRCGPRT
jgi:hypothetical protein